ncbi:MAG: hypothetical protein ACLSAF_04850 [Intestinimonas sp.]
MLRDAGRRITGQIQPDDMAGFSTEKKVPKRLGTESSSTGNDLLSTGQNKTSHKK